MLVKIVSVGGEVCEGCEEVTGVVMVDGERVGQFTVYVSDYKVGFGPSIDAWASGELVDFFDAVGEDRARVVGEVMGAIRRAVRP